MDIVVAFTFNFEQVSASEPVHTLKTMVIYMCPITDSRFF